MDTINIRGHLYPMRWLVTKAYSYLRIREWMSSLGLKAVIPNRSNQPEVAIDKVKYKCGNVVDYV